MKIQKTSYFFALICVPGTFFHELMHYITALILRAGPSNFSIIPKKYEDRIVYGSVVLSNLNIVNAAPVAMAPFLLAPLAYLSLKEGSFFVLNEYGPIGLLIFSFLNANVLLACIPSVEDFKISFVSLIFYMVIGLAIFYY